MTRDLQFVVAMGQLTIQLLFLTLGAMAIMAATMLAVHAMAPSDRTPNDEAS